MKFSNYHWRILYMFCECCKQELMSVCLFVFMGSWMSGVTLLHNLIWPADDGELFITLSPRCVVFLLWIWYISNYVNDVSDRIIWFPPGVYGKFNEKNYKRVNIYVYCSQRNTHRNWMYRGQVLLLFRRTTSVLILTFKIKKRMKEQGLG